MLRFGGSVRSLRDFCGVHPDVPRLSWSFPGPPIALRDDAGELSWRELDDRIERLAARFSEDRLQPGQSVAILGT